MLSRYRAEMHLEMGLAFMLIESFLQGVILIVSEPPPLWKPYHRLAELHRATSSFHQSSGLKRLLYESKHLK